MEKIDHFGDYIHDKAETPPLLALENSQTAAGNTNAGSSIRNTAG